MVDDGHAAAQRFGLFHGVGRQQDSAAVAMEAADHLPDDAPRAGVEGRGRLVEQHHLLSLIHI